MTQSPLRVEEDHQNAKKPYSKEKNWNDRKNTGKGKQKACLVEEDMGSSEEQFGPDEDIDYYNPDMHEEDHSFDEEPEANFTSTVTSEAKPIGPQCRTCLVHSASNNKLHHHLRKDNCKREIQVAHAVTQKTHSHVPTALPPTPLPTPMLTSSKSSTRRVIESTADPNQEIGTGYGFRGWKYATGMVSFTEAEDFFSPGSCCFDSRTGVTLVGRESFQKQAGPRISIRTMATPITVRGIGTTQHKTDEYAIVPFMFEDTQRGQPVLARFWREVHLVDELKANLLIGIDIMGPELVTVDMGQKKVIRGSCNVEIPIEIKTRSRSAQGIQRPIHAQKTTVIPGHCVLPVYIHHLYQVPKDRDYLLEPGEVNFGLYAHMVNSETSNVLVQNNSSYPLRISRNFRLRHIIELEYPNAFTVEATELADLALRQPKSHHKAIWFRKLVTAYAAAASTVFSSQPSPIASTGAFAFHNNALLHADTKGNPSTSSEVSCLMELPFTTQGRVQYKSSQQ